MLINGIDIVGCGLSQNIKKKLAEKEKEKINLIMCAPNPFTKSKGFNEEVN